MNGVPARVFWPIGAHALLRIASGTSGILVGLYLGSLKNQGAHIDVGLVGTLGAVSFGAELFASVPLGLASDVLERRRLMAGGAVVGGFAALIFALSGSPAIFFLSRILEGIAAAAIVPALLAYLADATEGRAGLRVRAMSFFELSLLAGLALGGIAAAQLFRTLHAGAFAVVACIYLACAAILWFSVSGRQVRRLANPFAALTGVLRIPSLRRLAPVWLCVNAIVGLWLGPTLPFLLTQRTTSTQYLAGLYADDPAGVGWLLLGYAIVFGAGVTVWSVILPRMRLQRAMSITVGAMIPVCAAIYFLNHSAAHSVLVRWMAGTVLALLVMIESGFTPAALAWLAQTLPVQSGRGAAMGIYSLLLSVGAIAGSLLAAFLGARFSIDGLLYGTVLMAVAALALLRSPRALERRTMDQTT